MPKLIKMPRRRQPENPDHPTHRSMILSDALEESDSFARIQRWLEIADSALQNKPTSDKKRSASAVSEQRFFPFAKAAEDVLPFDATPSAALGLVHQRKFGTVVPSVRVFRPA